MVYTQRKLNYNNLTQNLTFITKEVIQKYDHKFYISHVFMRMFLPFAR